MGDVVAESLVVVLPFETDRFASTFYNFVIFDRNSKVLRRPNNLACKPHFLDTMAHASSSMMAVYVQLSIASDRMQY